MDKIVFFNTKYITILVKSLCRGPFLVAVCGVFILRGNILLHYVDIFSYGLLDETVNY
jgi:hypothetical protein